MGLKQANTTSLEKYVEKDNANTPPMGSLAYMPYEAKDRRISRQGLFQAALQTTAAQQFAPDATLESYLETVRKIADAGLKYVSE